MRNINRSMNKCRKSGRYNTDSRRCIYIKDWKKGYRNCHYMRVYGKLTYSIEYFEGYKSTDEIHTDIPDLIILENGDNQDLWIETIKSLWKQRKQHKETLKDIKELKWISWEENDTINQELYTVEYTKVEIPFKDSQKLVKQKVVLEGISIIELFHILNWSKSNEGRSTYTDGSLVKGQDCKKIFYNEDVIIHPYGNNSKRLKKLERSLKITGGWETLPLIYEERLNEDEEVTV